MKRIEDFIKHDPHCLAGKYSTIGRCSCGAQAALEELAALREAVQPSADTMRKITSDDRTGELPLLPQ